MGPAEAPPARGGGQPGELRVTLLRSPGPRHTEEIHLVLPAGATVADALARCGWWPAGGAGEAREPPSVGVWGKPGRLDRPLRDLDRVEVYRGLRVDPMQARRERHAGHQAKAQVAAQLAARRKKGKGPR